MRRREENLKRRQVCLKSKEKPVPREGEWKKVTSKFGLSFPANQSFVFLKGLINRAGGSRAFWAGWKQQKNESYISAQGMIAGMQRGLSSQKYPMAFFMHKVRLEKSFTSPSGFRIYE